MRRRAREWHPEPTAHHADSGENQTSETDNGTRIYWEGLDEFGDVRLENFDKCTLQTHLNKLAKTRSRDRVLQIRAYIKAIFAEAVDQDFLPKDPARTLKTPANLRDGQDGAELGTTRSGLGQARPA